MHQVLKDCEFLFHLNAKHEILSSRLKDVIQQHEECQQLLSEANKEKKELENRLAELQNCAKYEK